MSCQQKLFGPLLERTLENAQIQHLATRYDLSKESKLARAIVTTVNQVLDREERRRQIRRVHTGELLLHTKRGPLLLPIRTQEDIERLIAGERWPEVRADILRRCQARYRELFPEASPRDLEAFLRTLWQLRPYPPRGAARPLWGTKRQRPWGNTLGEGKPLMELDLARARRGRLPEVPRPAHRPATLRRLLHYLGTEAGIPPAVQEPLLLELMAIRARFHPRLRTLRSGRMPLAAIHVETGRRLWQPTRHQPLAPVAVTLLAERESSILRHRPPKRYENYLAFLGRRMARVLTEAYVQDGLLSFTELQWIFLVSTATVSRAIDYYQKQHQVILPCPGTVLDMGRMLTHKALIIRLHLQGMTVLEIARQTYHHPRSIDAYLKAFDAVLILHLYGIPAPLMARILGRGEYLVNEYLELVGEHLKKPEVMRAYLRDRGVNIPASADLPALA
jgi:hypothetical protein